MISTLFDIKETDPVSTFLIRLCGLSRSNPFQNSTNWEKNWVKIEPRFVRRFSFTLTLRTVYVFVGVFSSEANATIRLEGPKCDRNLHARHSKNVKLQVFCFIYTFLQCVIGLLRFGGLIKSDHVGTKLYNEENKLFIAWRYYYPWKITFTTHLFN
jgi:hypothetical protein